MRRMYSEQELTKVIKEVFEAELASGALDEQVSDAVDAYLVEHPVDITALEGQTINPARIDVANINGETNPSVKPLYYHPIYALDLDENMNLTCVIINNSATPFTATTFKAFIEDNNGFSLCPISGMIKIGDSMIIDVIRLANYSSTIYAYGRNTYNNSVVNAENITSKWNNFLAEGHTVSFEDAVNKIN